VVEDGEEGSDVPVSWMTRGTSKTSCSHLPDDWRERKSLVQEEDELREHEGYKVPEMHTVAARAAPCIEEERLPLLIPVKDGAEITDRGHI
jgi:hypothetical protein